MIAFSLLCCPAESRSPINTQSFITTTALLPTRSESAAKQCLSWAKCFRVEFEDGSSIDFSDVEIRTDASLRKNRLMMCSWVISQCFFST